MTVDRRDMLRFALCAVSLGLAGALPKPLAAMIKPGVRKLRGSARINGRPAREGDFIGAGDRVTTGPDGEAVFVVEDNAYLLRGDSDLTLPKSTPAEQVLQVVSGQVLAVFGRRPLTVDAPLATIGIRGTGAYLEVYPERNYVCLCYGKAVLTSKANPEKSESLDAFHHDNPRNMLAMPTGAGMLIEPAKMINHQDEELIMLEALVGRIPLFGPKPIKM